MPGQSLSARMRMKAAASFFRMAGISFVCCVVPIAGIFSLSLPLSLFSRSSLCRRFALCGDTSTTKSHHSYVGTILFSRRPHLRHTCITPCGHRTEHSARHSDESIGKQNKTHCSVRCANFITFQNKINQQQSNLIRTHLH